MQTLLEEIKNLYRKDYTDKVRMQVLADAKIESDDESSMHTMAIAFKVYDRLAYPEPDMFNEEALDYEVQICDTVREMATQYLLHQLNNYEDQSSVKVTQTEGFTQINGYGRNLLHQATILVSDHTVYITLYFSGQW